MRGAGRMVGLRSPMALAVVAVLCVTGCGGSSDTDDDAIATVPRTDAPATTTAAEPKTSLTTATRPAVQRPNAGQLAGLSRQDLAVVEGYLAWTELTLNTTNTTGSGAHPGTKRVFFGPPSLRARVPYPEGSVIVKQGSTGGAVTLLAIMEKVRASDPATGGWRYVEYKRADGSERYDQVAFPESGCASCHLQANQGEGGGDWVFSSP